MRVSIVVTSYNYGPYLRKCIDSCLNQSMDSNEFEVIVVDDCSSDDSRKIIKEYESVPNFKSVLNKNNLGVAGSANAGIRAAQGESLIRVDADDTVSPDFILFLKEYLDANSNAFCVSCDYIYVDNDDQHLERIYSEEKPVSCGIMYRRNQLMKFGMYDEKWRHREEEELRKRLGNHYAIHHLKIPLYFYRMHKSNKTKQLNMMDQFRQKLESVRPVDTIPLNLEKISDSKLPLDHNVVAIIPARGGSQRLKHKNIITVLGKPMIVWAIEAALESKYISTVYVSTESIEIRRIALAAGAKVLERPLKLSEGKVYKQDVIAYATHQITEAGNRPTLVVSLQANSPEVTAKDLDQCIAHLIKHSRQEVVSVDENLNQNAAIRVMTYNGVFQRTLSTNLGVTVTDLLDVHTIEDIQKIEQRIKHRLNQKEVPLDATPFELSK